MTRNDCNVFLWWIIIGPRKLEIFLVLRPCSIMLRILNLGSLVTARNLALQYMAYRGLGAGTLLPKYKQHQGDYIYCKSNKIRPLFFPLCLFDLTASFRSFLVVKRLVSKGRSLRCRILPVLRWHCYYHLGSSLKRLETIDMLL